jgi:hypothetical protein
MTQPLPPAGDFGWHTLNATCHFVPAGLEANERLLGLPFQFTTIYGTLRADDGAVFTLTRRIARGDGGLGRLILQQATPAQPHLALCGEGRTTSRATHCHRDWDGNTLRYATAMGGTDKPFELSCGASMHWHEKELLDLSGPGVGPGLQYYLPHEGGGLLYASHYHYLEGRILGKSVRGFVCADHTWKPDAVPAPDQKHSPNPLVQHGIGVAMFNWANRYADGRMEIGLFGIGHRKFGIGLYAGPGDEVVATSHIDGAIHVDPDNMPATIDFDLAGKRWTFERDPRGTMPGIASDALELDGVMRGPDGRQPEVWFCWGQSYPGNGLRPRR